MRVSASKYGLFRNCQAWANESAKWFSEVSQAATDGVAVHKVIEDDLSATEPKTGSARWLRSLGGRVLAEAAFGLDPDSGKAAHIEVEGRDYPKHMLCGRADAVVLVGDKAIVVDWKSGVVRRYHKDQLELLSAMVADALGIRDVSYAVAYVNMEGNLRFRSEPQVVPLRDAADVLQEACSLVAQIGVAEPWPGAHCAEQYCPHAAYCKEGDKVTMKAIEADLEVTDMNAADMLVLVHLLKERVKRAESDLKSIARSNGGIVVDGRKWSERIGSARVFDQKRAAEIARAAGATDDDLYRVVERSQGFRF